MVIIFIKKIKIVLLKRDIICKKKHIDKTKSKNKKGIRWDYFILKAE